MAEEGYPKEYNIWVCPPSKMEEHLPVYECQDATVYLAAGKCVACKSDLEQIGAADTSMYLATYELWA